MAFMFMALSSIAKSSYIGFVLLLSNFAYAGQIRTIDVDSSTMGKVYLKLGQSTVLRFREKPKKVVVGNQNYFNIEFIENDLTIQPQENVTSNLFVYGEYHTYGIILNAGNSYNYDDLVNVRWKNKSQKLILSEPKAKERKKKKREFFKITLLGSEYDSHKNVAYSDVEILNNSGNAINTEAIRTELREEGKTVAHTCIFKDETAASGKKGKARIIFGKSKHDLKLTFFINEKDYSLKIAPSFK